MLVQAWRTLSRRRPARARQQMSDVAHELEADAGDRRRWPRLMCKRTAAEYCDMSPATFAARVRDGSLPQKSKRYKRWDRQALDDAIDRETGRKRRSAAT